MNVIPWWNVDFGEMSAQAAYKAVVERRMTMGPLVRQFEEELMKFTGAPYVVSTSSGTAALSLALLVAGVGPGDEVIVPARTWISTAHSPLLLGAKVVFVDVVEDKPTMSPTGFEAAITSRTKAVIPVHLNGRLSDMDAINAIAAKHGIAVIEDACQAIFSQFPDGSCAGTKSLAGCFSFAIGKPLSCGQGGAVVTSDPEIARKLVLARTHGTSDVTMAQWEMRGGNFRFWDLPASVALVQMSRIAQRKQAILALYKRYKGMLGGIRDIRLLPDNIEGGEIPIYVECVTPRREELVRFLKERDIQARPYYSNLNTAPQFQDGGPNEFPNSDIYAHQCLVLPSGPDQSNDDIERVFAALEEWNNIKDA